MFAQHIVSENKKYDEIKAYLNFFDVHAWEKYTGITKWQIESDDCGNRGYAPVAVQQRRAVTLALIICTYHRHEQIEKNVKKLMTMKFFDSRESDYFRHLYIFIVDNEAGEGKALELEDCDSDFLKVIPNRNTGGSGGFQKGLEYIRAVNAEFTHVIFMDDDADFLPETFYRLYALLTYMKPEYYNCSVAGRMFCLDYPTVQYTAAEIWNRGILQHVAFMEDMSKKDFSDNGATFEESDLLPDTRIPLNFSGGADYGGWWFCCYPYEFCSKNDIMPFFIHCDDVEYGLRFLENGGGRPIILNGIQVWHETAVYRQNPIIQYYDMRNPLFVNEKYGLMDYFEMLEWWKARISSFHVCGDYASEYYTILALLDFMKGQEWLYKIDSELHHRKLMDKRISRYKNAVLWRIAERRFRERYL
ncbi:glycosyltransferase family 2 protein [Butyrivibrio sp. INlla16]|uniref:glycosyltransferase family 2 protein n=1 Tax=Butyrivibrio sp. INlla16 TaxID=1520807 RepID=UPI0008818FDB|nr:glycosyltransferase [Butyrivibrio sp. INlla16]SDB32078.1 Glycosyltransferase, GT2 family [Butyrivibrio sp. INlla16]